MSGQPVTTAFPADLRTPEGPIQVRLATFTDIDPPFELAARLGGRFIAITEARDCAATELELLRQAYVVLMG